MGVLPRRDWYVAATDPPMTISVLVFLVKRIGTWENHELLTDLVRSWDDGYTYCTSPWYDWGRWVALAVIVAIGFIVFFGLAYVFLVLDDLSPKNMS